MAATGSGGSTGRWALAWPVLGAAYLLFAFLFSVIQPLSAVPDEAAHMQYVRVLATRHRLPGWGPSSGWEGGYEAQHPPLAYAVQAVAYRAARPLPENFRWQTVRWLMVVLGLGLLPLLRALAGRLFPDDSLHQVAYAATVLLMPLTLLYFSHANPDGVALLVSTAGFLLAARIVGDPVGRPWFAPAAGAIAALAALTKLSAAPLGLVLLAALWLRPGPGGRARSVATMLGIWLAGCGWWYARNAVLYGHPFLHSPGRKGTGLDLAHRYGPGGIPVTTWAELRETFLSVWVQRDWFPGDLDPWLYGLIELFVLLALGGAVFGPRAAREKRLRDQFSPWASALFLAALLLGQQVAFWTVDVEFNTGGRYLLPALPALAYLLLRGVSRWPRRVAVPALWAWLIALPLMNLASADNITGLLVPYYFPGWRMFEFPHGPH